MRSDLAYNFCSGVSRSDFDTNGEGNVVIIVASVDMVMF